MDFFQCLPLDKARDRIAGSLAGVTVAPETVLLIDALGRVAAQDLRSPEDLPPFSRSTVDGFAVRSADTFGASETAPAFFVVIGEVFMGQAAPMELAPGQAVAIPTGGMVPAGADAVIMLEYTEQPDRQTLLALKPVAPGENMVAKGEDVSAGRRMVKQGQKITPGHIGVLAACGITEVLVRQRVKVALISTGDELVDIHETVQMGQIRDVNSYALGAMLKEAGCQVTLMGIVRDCGADFIEALQKATKDHHLVIISGGSSVGARDYTVEAINALGDPGVLFHGIAVKPGKPTIFGMIHQVPIFGLPGHPVAAMVVSEQVVKPALRLLSGQSEYTEPYRVSASLGRNLASTPGRDDFFWIRLHPQGESYRAEPILGKSGLIGLITEADGMLHIPADQSGLYDGEQVKIMLTRSRE
ncbi:gephyrin-like molybdotransferase Glp [Heliophilum fasciatum]|uniref:Molybdopterin molybdenumtransferase n=1 Tax=Heliophilum fasciatum TaxID=35700 RepID=A0A4R2RLY9_9FIRM|nr:gephyrin-like molybdotransferase Glp [Heliophilum fasciatum]MCW2278195.1 molybdopterin molybdotransferase [Heliophilum fasciatum]TCP63984.1 molybdopterin molybdochelatase [Heliophilum fasciatum]